MIDLTADQLEHWYTALSRRVKPSTQAGELSGVRAFYAWAQVCGLRDDNPAAGLPRPTVPAGMPRPISDEDLTMALRLASGRVRSAMILAAFAGLRAAEIAAAERKHLHGSWIEVTGKGGKVRAVDAHHLVAEQYRAGQPYVFPRLDGLAGAATPWLVSQHVNRHLHGLGVDATCHQLRHWFATNLYQQTQDILLTQNMLGHSSPKTTAIYADYNHDGPTVELLPAVA